MKSLMPLTLLSLTLLILGHGVVVGGTPTTGGYDYAVIHYNRPADDYGDHTTGDFNDFWGLHLWGDAIDPSEGTEWFDPKPFLAEDIVHHSMNRDVLDVLVGGHWSDAGHRHHFMRAENETERQAYQNGLTWIENNGKTASHYLRQLYKRRTTRDFPPGHIAGPLGYAFHALQDSFAPCT